MNGTPLHGTHDGYATRQASGDLMAAGSPINRSAPAEERFPEAAASINAAAAAPRHSYFAGQGPDVELAGFRLQALLGVDRFRVDHEKAAARHGRHAEAARKAVSGLRSLLGSAVAEPMNEHVRALVSDVAKAASVAAGAIAYADRLGSDLATTRQALQNARRERAECIGMVSSTLGEPSPGDGPDVSLPAGVSTLAGQLAQANYKLNALRPVVARLIRRQTVAQERAAELRYQTLAASLERAVAAGKIPRSTVRHWLASAESAAADHLESRARSFESVWQDRWDGTAHTDEWLLDDVLSTESTATAVIDGYAINDVLDAQAAGPHA